MRRIPLHLRILLYGSMIVSIISIFFGVIFYFIMSNAIKQEIGERALSIAVTTAKRPDIIAGFDANDPHQVLQPIAESIRSETKAEYVVIGNKDGIRYAHPILDRIGKKMVGDDNERALLYGESYVSEAVGSLGHALRGKAPVKNEKGEIIGIISVGYMMEDISSLFFQYGEMISYVVLISIGLGIIGAALLAKNIKKMMFGMEPDEVANLLTERNTLIESVREGIIMVDAAGRIKMINKSAMEVLSVSNDMNLKGEYIEKILPKSLLPAVLKNGRDLLNQPMRVNGKKVIVDRIPMLADGKIIGAVSSFRLQSEIDHLANELSQVKSYTEALRAQTHDYKNFLYTISGPIQLNSSDEALQLIHNETELHQSLIQFITKRLQDPYLGGLIIGLFNRAKELKIQFLLDEDSYLERIPKHLEKSYFVSILGNLVTNAFEAVEGLPEPDRFVRVLILNNGKEILIEVEDSGSGIDSAILPSLFHRRVSTKGKKGRGYGLIKVRENVSNLGGNLYLEKGDLGGALFIISVPVRGDMDGKQY